jgi:hypothetical protein
MATFQMRLLIVLAFWPILVISEELTTVIDHMQLILNDAFNGSYLVKKGFKGSFENTNVIPGTVIYIKSTFINIHF